MADNKLNVEIGATTTGLDKGLKRAETGLKGFEKATVKTDKTVGKLSKTTNANATPALQEFSRVIQDAPYGIQGVANNITQLTSQFGYLSQKTGGAGAALKSMVSSMVGPAGILFAISAITSLWVSYEKEIKAAFGSQDRLIQSMKDYVSEAQVEILTLKQLVSIARDENKSKKVRQGAIDELNKNYKQYLGNLDLESVKTSKVTESVEALSKALIIQAKIKGVADLIAERGKENTAKILTLEESRLKTEEKLALLQTKSNKDNLRQRQGLKKALERINSELEVLETKASDAFKPLLKIQGALKEAGFETTPTAGANGGGSGGSGSGRDKLKALGFPGVEDLSKYSKELYKALQQNFNPSGKKGVQLIDSEATLAQMGEDVARIVEGMPEMTSPITNSLLDFSEAASSIISNGITNTFTGIGKAIGEGLANGDDILKTVGSALLSGIGQVATELGAAAIAIGVGMIAIQGAFSNPFTAIAAGVALVAIGSAISAAAQTTSAVGGGGSSGAGVSGGGSSSGGYGSNYSSSGGGGSSAGGTYVFEIAGTKLVGVLQNTLDRNRNLGGTNRLSFSG